MAAPTSPPTVIAPIVPKNSSAGGLGGVVDICLAILRTGWNRGREFILCCERFFSLFFKFYFSHNYFIILNLQNFKLKNFKSKLIFHQSQPKNQK